MRSRRRRRRRRDACWRYELNLDQGLKMTMKMEMRMLAARRGGEREDEKEGAGEKVTDLSRLETRREWAACPLSETCPASPATRPSRIPLSLPLLCSGGGAVCSALLVVESGSSDHPPACLASPCPTPCSAHTFLLYHSLCLSLAATMRERRRSVLSCASPTPLSFPSPRLLFSSPSALPPPSGRFLCEAGRKEG